MAMSMWLPVMADTGNAPNVSHGEYFEKKGAVS
jgi:hypothetical protein